MMHDGVSSHMLDWGSRDVCVLAHEKHVRELVARHLPVHMFACPKGLICGAERSELIHHGPGFDAHSTTRPNLENSLKCIEQDTRPILYRPPVQISPSIG